MNRGLSRRRFTLGATLALSAPPLLTMETENYKRLGLDKRFTGPDPLNGRSNREIMDALAVPEDAQYNPCAEAFPGDDVPRGEITSFAGWSDTNIYAGTTRDMWAYVPQQLESGAAPSLMVFNDGGGYLQPEGAVRATAVLDSLTHVGAIPPTVAIFIMPGRQIVEADTPSGGQRSFEYDSLTDTYVRFLVDEAIPFVESRIGSSVTDDPARRTICGISSGGICAFNAAWHRPRAFGKVLSHCGSFVNISGGHNYPYLVKSTPRKPIKVFMTSGARDANIIVGNWSLANKMMAQALLFAGYETKFVFGEGGHSLRHGGAIFADSLRWLEA